MAVLIANINKDITCNSKIDKLLGFETDSHLDFDEQVSHLCKKVNQKHSAIFSQKCAKKTFEMSF